MLLREGRILSLSANGKVSHLHEAYHCPLCFLFLGSDPGPPPGLPGPLHCPSAEPLLPAQALFIAVLSPSAPPSPAPWKFTFFVLLDEILLQRQFGKWGSPSDVAALRMHRGFRFPLLEWCKHRIKSTSLSPDASQHIRSISGHFSKKIRHFVFFCCLDK